MKVVFSALCVLVLAVVATAKPELTHDHIFKCSDGGIFSFPDDKCLGFHVCGYNYKTKDFDHQFIECENGMVFNGQSCVSKEEYTCPY